MKNIVFKLISIEGFGSYVKPFTFNLDNQGINIIKGKNGVGKTTIFNALYWCLYGKSVKDCNQSDVVTWEYLRDKKWRGTQVGLIFDIDGVEYAIYRHLKFNTNIFYKDNDLGIKGSSNLVILKDGEIVKDHLYKNDQQKYINDLLGMDSNLFINTIFFPQRALRFLSASAEDKRKIYEEIFNLSFIERAKENAKAKEELLKNNLLSLNKEKNILFLESKNIEKEIEINQKEIDFFLDKKDSQIAEYNSFINEFRILINNIDMSIFKDTDFYINKIGLLNNDKKDKEVSLEDIKKEIKEIEREINKKAIDMNHHTMHLEGYTKTFNYKSESLNNKEVLCPTCNTKLSDDKISEIYYYKVEELESCKRQIEIHKEGIKRCDDSLLVQLLKDKEIHLQKIEDELKLINIELSEISIEVRTLKNNKNNINNYQEKIKKYEELIIALNSKKPDYAKLASLREDLMGIEKKIEDLSFDISVVENELKLVSWWASKGFGNSGLRSYIINSMLSAFNEKANLYANHIGMYLDFSIDLTKANKPMVSKIYNKNNVEVDYGLLSGGEQQKVDICTSFALHDLISSSNKINILILDEVFEGIDDYNGTDEVFELIRYKVGMDKSVFVITHSSNMSVINSREIALN